VLGDWVVEVSASSNVILLRTPPGSAHVVASALDRAGVDGVLGTVAGDDTVFVATAGAREQKRFLQRLRRLLTR
jgi:transcriptional regulator of arginine metabolism